MSFVKASLIALAGFAVLATAEIDYRPADQHDVAKASFTRFCEWKMERGGHANCEEFYKLSPGVQYYRRELTKIYTNPNLTPEQKEELVKPLADKYLADTIRSNKLMQIIDAEKYEEFVGFCGRNPTNPVCKNRFDRSLYAEVDEDVVPTRRITKKSNKKALAAMLDEMEAEEQLHHVIKPTQRVRHRRITRQ